MKNSVIKVLLSCAYISSRKYGSINSLNPFANFESNHSLDRLLEIRDTGAMQPGDTSILLKRVDPDRNMNRYYHLSVEPSLFGEFAVRRTWGRVGTLGLSRLDLFADALSAQAHQHKLAAQKHMRGYRPA
ncbi:WGR domain-containing protein [Roseibium sp.]|uniref:WGR domain-containing protein n=2 Tax=Roseibium sp. TaxID=1936156 RepID=UPI003267F01F